ncbi:MAG: Rid family detoxifying hydrolase [Eubacteriales bacterium]|nr:Rid family detoxifying hydrolase [Eubacteriales bacterium]
MKAIATDKAPAALGPYTQAYENNGTLMASGQIGINPATGKLPATVAEQAEQACKNVAAILEEAGYTFDNVIKTTCFLADIADFGAFNEVYGKYFTSKPARSCVAVKDIPAGALCEIEITAVK